jgi:23S rRNA (cytosine1962-C5)-methyltransferase
MRQQRFTNRPQKLPFVSNTTGLDYELIDCGNQRKLERFGTVVLNRPEVSAKHKPACSKVTWESADWYFFEEKGKKGEWKSKNELGKNWKIHYQKESLNLQFLLELTAFKHIGLFPEQTENWHYIQQQLNAIKGKKRVLNLFAYTGAASLVSAACGAKVTNVESVKQVMNWSRENAKINKLEHIRWILEDARKYVKKAIRRKEEFEGIILDPPTFGYGSNKERWKIETDLEPLLHDLLKLLNRREGFFILNTYSPKMPQDKLTSILENLEHPRLKNRQLVDLGLKSQKNQQVKLGLLFRF